MASELTTLQVARKIADAVLESVAFTEAILESATYREPTDALDPPTQAVLRVLHETGTWLFAWTDEGESVTRLEAADTAEPADDEPTLF